MAEYIEDGAQTGGGAIWDESGRRVGARSPNVSDHHVSESNSARPITQSEFDGERVGEPQYSGYQPEMDPRSDAYLSSVDDIGDVHLETQPHWFMLALPSVVCAFIACVGGVLVWLLGKDPSELPFGVTPGSTIENVWSFLGEHMALVLAAIWGVAVIGWLWNWLNWRRTVYRIITYPNGTAEIYKRFGIFGEHERHVRFSAINNLNMDTNLIGVVTGWGHIDILSGNDSKEDHLSYVPNPKRFQMIYRSLVAQGFGGGQPVQRAGQDKVYPENRMRRSDN